MTAWIDWVNALDLNTLYLLLGVVAFVESIFPPAPADLVVAFGGAPQGGGAPSAASVSGGAPGGASGGVSGTQPANQPAQAKNVKIPEYFDELIRNPNFDAAKRVISVSAGYRPNAAGVTLNRRRPKPKSSIV